MFLDHLPRRHFIAKLRRAVSLEGIGNNETYGLIFSAASDVVRLLEEYALRGAAWDIAFALALAEDDNPLGRAAELRPDPAGTVCGLASGELWDILRTLAAVKKFIDTDDQYASLRPLSDYTPANDRALPLHGDTRARVLELAGALAQAANAEEALRGLAHFYSACGSGPFALNRAFRWSAGRLLPVRDLDPQRLDDLVGYASQKAELLANTEHFVRGRSANNVLLYGDSGTGKSSSVRALLNEERLVAAGLRMVELYKDQFREIPELLQVLRGRNYRFVIFMDDLSFEEFEVEYKYLKALIEGGIERKPENVVICATSNRRNLVREVWNDRKQSSDDVHGWDTMQEKLSLADRFGVTIWYGAANKEQYMEIVRALASECGIDVDHDALERLALRWEIGKGSFTGRTARQFVQHLLVEGMEDD